LSRIEGSCPEVGVLELSILRTGRPRRHPLSISPLARSLPLAPLPRERVRSLAHRVQLHLVVGFRFRGIVLQNSKVAGLQICRENTKQEAIADSYNLSRVTEVACKFSVGP
jgi:hypothetical protein